MIAFGVNSNMQELVTSELEPLVEVSLDNISQTSIHNAKSRIRSVVHNILEHEILDLLSSDLIRKTLEARIATTSTPLQLLRCC